MLSSSGIKLDELECRPLLHQTGFRRRPALIVAEYDHCLFLSQMELVHRLACSVEEFSHLLLDHQMGTNHRLDFFVAELIELRLGV